MSTARRADSTRILAWNTASARQRRRSAIREMVWRGIPETVCMKISGHKTRHIFDAYNLSNERDLADATAKIELGRQVSTTTHTDTQTDTVPISAEHTHTRKRA